MTDAIVELAALAQRLAHAPDVVEDVLGQLAEEVVDLIKAGHDAGEDPYGNTWAPKADGGASHLFDNGDLRGGWHVSSKGGDSFTVSPTAFYAAVHQGGKTIVPVHAKRLRFKLGGKTVFAQRVRIPQRRMVPDKGLPDAWAAALKETAEATMEHLLGK